MREQLTEDTQRREKALAVHTVDDNSDEEELTFGACQNCVHCSSGAHFDMHSCLAEEYVEVAQQAAAEEGGDGCEDELDREQLRHLFDEVDVDCSGTVTLSELSAHRQRLQDSMRNRQREAFQKVRAEPLSFHKNK